MLQGASPLGTATHGTIGYPPGPPMVLPTMPPHPGYMAGYQYSDTSPLASPLGLAMDPALLAHHAAFDTTR